MRKLTALAAAAATSLVSLASLATPAEANTKGHPYSQPGCQNSWLDADEAKACRKDGWTVHRRFVLNPHGVIRYWNLATCEYEDGSGTTKACGWLGDYNGNGRGVSYAVTGNENPDRTYTYVWHISPLRDHPNRRWVTAAEAEVLTEDLHPRNWRHCWTNDVKVACPDGFSTKVD